MIGIDAAVARIRAWGEARDWRGRDPYDALTSPLAPALTLGSPLGRRLLTQAVKRSPLDLRPLLRIPPAHNAKALALVASGYARLAAAGDESARPAAERWLAWLDANRALGGRGWGYHFDVQTRFFHYSAQTPNAIATSFAAQAFLDGVELLGDPRWLDPAEEACEFLLEELLRSGPAGPYFAYLPGHDELVHNANALCCAVLDRRGARPDVVAEAIATTLAAQRADGSWPYAEGPAGDWVDNFHTAYILESLARIGAPEALARGCDYWERALFLADGTPRYSPERTYPLDAHCYASAVDAWLALGELGRAERVAALLVERMLDPSGKVHFQQRRLHMSRVPFIRWTAAPSFRALAGVLLAHARLG